MENYKLAMQFDLFKGINELDFYALNNCFKTKIKVFEKGEFIVEEGSELTNLVMILKGTAFNISYTSNNSNISEILSSGDIFCLDEAIENKPAYSSNLQAKTKCEVMFLNKNRVLNPCFNMCARHLTVKDNLFKIITNKYNQLKQKMNILSKRTTKEKVLYYLYTQSNEKIGVFFDIPLSRQQMADYLMVDRSALSQELSKLKFHGQIDFDKNHFLIKRL